MDRHGDSDIGHKEGKDDDLEYQDEEEIADGVPQDAANVKRMEYIKTQEMSSQE